MPTNGKPTDLSPKPWQEKVDPDFHLRLPRSGVGYVETLLDSSWPPEIFLTENEQSTDIVIRFPASSQNCRMRFLIPTSQKISPLRKHSMKCSEDLQIKMEKELHALN